MTHLVQFPTDSGPQAVNPRYVVRVHAASGDPDVTVLHLDEGVTGTVVMVKLPYLAVRLRLAEARVTA